MMLSQKLCPQDVFAITMETNIDNPINLTGKMNPILVVKTYGTEIVVAKRTNKNIK